MNSSLLVALHITAVIVVVTVVQYISVVVWYSISVVQRQENCQNIQFWLFSVNLVIYSLNLSNISFNIDGSLWCWQDLLVAGVHFHSNIFPLAIISYLASSEQIPGRGHLKPCRARHWECRSSYSRSGAGLSPAGNTLSEHFANIMCRNVSIATRENASTNHQSYCSFYLHHQYIIFWSEWILTSSSYIISKYIVFIK